MSDRELLKLAAKAAGIEHGADRVDCVLSLTTPDGRHRSLPQWNPLIDDGDALRLAVKLQLRVIPPEDEFGMDRASVRIAGRRDLVDAFHKDPFTATRRAIVMAAAEIGSHAMTDPLHPKTAQEAAEAADEIAALRKEAERYRWLLSQLAGMKRAEFFEPLRQHFYDTDEKYPDADDVQAAIDAAMLERVGVGAA